MLDLILAADAAATTPDRRALLDGISEDNPRSVQRALESSEDHAHLFADDFFYAVMGVAMGMCGTQVWSVLGDYGYSLDSKVRHPDEDESHPGTPPLMTLGQWGCLWLPGDRIDWLMEKGLLDPWKASGQGFSGAEMAMLSGSAEQFDIWLPRWSSRFLAHAARKGESSTGPFIPLVICTLAGMKSWQSGVQKSWQSAAKGDRSYPSNWPAREELDRRADKMLEAFLSSEYPGVPVTSRLGAMTKRPPWEPKHEKAVAFIARWQCANEVSPFRDPNEHHSLQDAWLCALLEAGCPLRRQGYPLLGRRLLEAILRLDENHESQDADTLRALSLYLSRASEEDPTVIDEVWGPIALSKRQEFPEHLAIDRKRWDLAAALIGLPGAPVARAPVNGGAILPHRILLALGEAVQKGDDELVKEVCETWSAWWRVAGDTKVTRRIPADCCTGNSKAIRLLVEKNPDRHQSRVKAMALDNTLPQGIAKPVRRM